MPLPGLRADAQATISGLLYRVSFFGPGRNDWGVTWTNDDAEKLGETLYELRKERGLTQEGLAYTAGLTKNSLQLLEAGRGSGRKDSTSPSNPRMSTLSRLAGVLGISVSQLLNKADL